MKHDISTDKGICILNKMAKKPVVLKTLQIGRLCSGEICVMVVSMDINLWCTLTFHFHSLFPTTANTHLRFPHIHISPISTRILIFYIYWQAL